MGSSKQIIIKCWKNNYFLWSSKAKLKTSQNIKQVYHTKFLGVYIEEKLRRKFHINYVSLKVSKLAGIITKLWRHYLELKNGSSLPDLF